MEGTGKNNSTENTLDIDSLMSEAENGDEEACRTLGDYYFDKKDYKEALEWYFKPADNSEYYYAFDDEMCKKHAICYQMLGNDTEAYEWWDKALDWCITVKNSEEPEIMYQLAQCYLNGKGTEKDIDKGMYYLDQAADQNFVPAVFELSDRYFSGDGVEQDPVKGLKLLKDGLRWGPGTFQDKYNEASAKLRKMTDEEFQFGMQYLKGEGVDKNLRKALEHFSRAEEWELDPAARDKLSEIIVNTRFKIKKEENLDRKRRLRDASVSEIIAEADSCLEENPYFAAELYMMAAEKGDIDAIEAAASAFEQALEFTLADEWYQKAYEYGSGSAAFWLGRHKLDVAKYFGSRPDWEKITGYYRFAAEQGNADAMHALGEYYHNEVKDDQKALYWLKKGNALAGREESGRLIREIEKKQADAEKKNNADISSYSYVDRDVTIEILGIIAVILLYLACPFFLKIGAGSSDVEAVIKLPFLLEPIVTMATIAAIVALNAFAWYSVGYSLSDSLSVITGLAGLIGGFIILFTMKEPGTLPKVQMIHKAIGIILILRIIMKKLKK